MQIAQIFTDFTDSYMTDFLYKEEGYKIIGCFYTVYNTLGHGFLESVYLEALSKEFEKNMTPYIREEKIDVFYQDEKLKKYFRADFLCYNDIIIEVKAEKFTSRASKEQVLNYLKASNHKVAYLINFGSDKIYIKRFINTPKSV